MKTTITFSVITVTYNAERCLRRTLDSVRAQRYHDIEHLIIDGASKDSTLAMAHDYAAKSKHKVVVMSEPDRGIYDAMNKGLRNATGDYIIYMNAGDSFPKSDTLEHISRCISDSCQQTGSGELPAVMYGDTDWTDDCGIVIGHRNHKAPKRLTWKSFKQGMLVCHQAFYARMDIARNIMYDLQYRHSADVDWCIRVMKEAERRQLPMVNVQEVVAQYQREGQTTANHKASLLERFHIMRKHYGLLTTVMMHAWFVIRRVTG
ncbi:MAG: glycosyltransferase [Bacteroidaceae bacterium]|nr:glycosyltransferase [Bacteroidaceae bacterium]